MKRYVFFATSDAHMKAAYQDLFNEDNVRYQMHYLHRPTMFLGFLQYMHCCSRIGRKLQLPLKSIWYGQYFTEKYEEGTKYVFIFFTNWHCIVESGYVFYLRKRYPKCKCVLFLQDVDNAKKLDIDYLKKIFDHIMIFEKNFAEEHGIAYHPLVYSSREIGALFSERPIDLLFVGQDKGRYKLLREIYDRLHRQGINCQFYISKTSKADKGFDVPEGIHMVDFVPYSQNIDLLKKSKCVLDIVPPDTNCNTLRMYEAIVYEVKVLTNNQHVITEDFYTSELISLYTTSRDIDVDFVKRPYTKVDYGCKDKISPLELLRYLDCVLEI